MTEPTKDQAHPRYAADRQVLNQILSEPPTDYYLAELARLNIRYQGFPGGRDIQNDIQKVLKKWQISEAELLQKTREIHAQGGIYTVRSNKREDWT